jgi:uncharacterized protein (TIGR02246 family)
MRWTYTRVIVFFLLVPIAAALAWGQNKEANSAAIKQVVANFSEAFNRHDAQASAMLFAENADFTNMRGASHHGRTEIEGLFKGLYTGVLKDAHRTDSVKNIRFLNADTAVMDADWEMTGAKGPNGAEMPVRKGLLDWVLTKQNGKWLITVFHESEFPGA